MSKSYHVTIKDLKGKTRDELNAMASDPDSLLHKLAEKKRTKREVKRKRKEDKK